MPAFRHPTNSIKAQKEMAYNLVRNLLMQHVSFKVYMESTDKK